MTANAMTGDRERCLEAGMNDHLAKPIDPDALWRKLLQWLKPWAGATAPRPAAQPAAPATAAVPGIPAIAGLDVATGLRYALGRESLYLSLLQKFASSQRNFPLQLAAALAERDWRTAKRHAHTLKGVAARRSRGSVRNRWPLPPGRRLISRRPTSLPSVPRWRARCPQTTSMPGACWKRTMRCCAWRCPPARRRRHFPAWLCRRLKQFLTAENPVSIDKPHHNAAAEFRDFP